MKANKLIILLSIILVLTLLSCEPKEERKKFIEEEPLSTSKEGLMALTYPDWIEDVAPKMEGDVYYPAIYERAYTLSEARKIYSEYIYLIEKYKEHYTENDNYYGWLKYTATMGINLEAYPTSYQMARTVEHFKFERKQKDYILSFNDMSPIVFISKYYMGDKEYAMEFYHHLIKENIDKLNPFMLHSIAYIMHLEGKEEEARLLYDEVLNYTDKKYANRLLTSALEACSYYYKMGEYDKVITISDTYISLGENPEDAYPYLYADKKFSKHFRENWNASYKLLNKYKSLALKAKNGEVIKMDHLKDGIFESSNTSYKGVPFNVSVVIENGQIKSIEASQKINGDETIDDRPFASVDIIPSKIINKNDYYVDAISSATVSSNSIKLGVMECLLKSSK